MSQTAEIGKVRGHSRGQGRAALPLAPPPDRVQSIELEWPRSEQRLIGDKAHLYIEGDPRTHAYKIVTGALCFYRVLEDGRRQVMNFAFPGDVVGLASGQRELCNAQALCSSEIRYLSVAALMAAARTNAGIAIGLYEALSREIIFAQEHLMCLGHRGATERVATFLIMLSSRNEMRGLSPDVVTLPMSRADIADFLGITIETVSRTLTKLRGQGLIDIEEITTLRLTKRSKLVSLAEGQERV